MWHMPLRLDIGYATKELARALPAPTLADHAIMEHLQRLLAGNASFLRLTTPKGSDLDIDAVTRGEFEMSGDELCEDDTIDDLEDDASLDRDLDACGDEELASEAVRSADGDGECENEELPEGDPERRADILSVRETDGPGLSDADIESD